MTPFKRHLEKDRLRLIDVGARGGLDPRWKRFETALELIAFEPDPEECERLNRDATSLPYPARFLPHALWREASDAVPFHVANWPVASSIYAPNEDFLRPFPEARRLLGVKDVQTGRRRGTARLRRRALLEPRARRGRTDPDPRAEAIGDPRGLLQSDLIRHRLRAPGPVAAQFSPAEVEDLEQFLVPRPRLGRRLAQWALSRLDAERRRALADSMQRPGESVWHDPHYF